MPANSFSHSAIPLRLVFLVTLIRAYGIKTGFLYANESGWHHNAVKVASRSASQRVTVAPRTEKAWLWKAMLFFNVRNSFLCAVTRKGVISIKIGAIVDPASYMVEWAFV